MIGLLRHILTMALIYGVYTETGPFTAAALFLIYIGIEMLVILVTSIQKSTDKMFDLTKERHEATNNRINSLTGLLGDLAATLSGRKT